MVNFDEHAVYVRQTVGRFVRIDRNIAAIMVYMDDINRVRFAR